MNHRDFLLEINVEDLPVGCIRPALKAVREGFIKEFKALHIDHGEVILSGTKNMLLCYIKDVSSQQGGISREIIGPAAAVAYDEKKNFTKQAIGFAKAQGVKAEDLRTKSTPKGEYVFVEKKAKAQATKDILKKIIPFVIKDMRFQKTMRWDASGLYFARPILSILALFGKERLSINIGNCPQKKQGPIDPKEYLARLQKRYLINPDQRKDGIQRLILKDLKRLGADPVIDESLLEEVTFMVTSPYLVAGDFDKGFLILPRRGINGQYVKIPEALSCNKKGPAYK